MNAPLLGSSEKFHFRAWCPKFVNGLNVCFTTISSHFFANNIFHKTEVQTVILRCWTGLKPNWFKSYDTNEKTRKNTKKITQMRSFLQNHKNQEMEIFAFFVITFEPKRSSVLQIYEKYLCRGWVPKFWWQNTKICLLIIE